MEEFYNDLNELLSHCPSDVEVELGEVYYALLDDESEE